MWRCGIALYNSFDGLRNKYCIGYTEASRVHNDYKLVLLGLEGTVSSRPEQGMESEC